MFSQPTRKRFGQHWLTSEKVLSKIVAAAAVTDQDIVLEIGPGTGVLTQSLLPLAQAVVAVEIDRDLHHRLSQKFAQKPNLYLIQGDFLTLDPTVLELPTPPPLDAVRSRPNKVVANIPYYITGPILEKLLGTIAHPNPQPYDSIVLLVQKEVAERLYAKPGSRAFGALSVRVQYLADCELVCPVPAKAFQPPPKVDSAVVKLTPRALPVAAESPDYLDQLVRLGFASKRKMLRNNLKATVDRDHLLTVMTELAIPETARAEDLGVPQWVALSNRLGPTQTQ
ncbi:16S rRNA (adenine(1518)-N(6)/adenine(1519)-N(6))-dimethyltransferase RsmA [Phormidium sp. FACHB-1136]|uniref:16S rRNA (adenine(1518)-N(6)/adenine(1519)-N(6))- dimethyltransferase RsmA n=1 Tax=Phormidium sp. FACHB-1136 TaxID=2692848 RepID=UPI00168443B8|nr:16S rRNA (adenine(1518)-N(6)/adenine(1519)-N(6))-dimethyltransferase RsmA [Phormidium sp. FACHB-1136]MBD2428137.1 16S rRNA (adenine(1518)-N(6)/adenine(1519)-N(6))-dimethyltransferase RsmA [Phormidium sp. FACHB-1136]